MTKVNIEQLDLLFTLSGADKHKVYTVCTENMRRLLENHKDFKDKIKHDLFENKTYIRHSGKSDDKWAEIQDHDIIKIQNKIASMFSFFQKVNRGMVQDAIAEVASNHTYDSGQDYLKSLKWDGVNRVDNWLTSVYGVEDNIYHRAVASNWLKGLVKRVMHPGCKFDYVLVLEGEQGTKKSSSLAVLGGNWYVETSMGTDTKDFFMLLQGKVLIEFSEGETNSRTDVKRMKAIISTGTDRYRPPYGRNMVDYPRRCVFAMTTNEGQYLKDETGNRRWLPVKTLHPEANVEWLKENREQLLAEAYHRVITLEETIWEFPKEETRLEQNNRMENDPQQVTIEYWYWNLLGASQRNAGVTTDQAYVEAIHKGFPSTPMIRYSEMIIGGVYQRMGLKKVRVMEKKVRINRYFPVTPEPIEEPTKSAEVKQGQLIMSEDDADNAFD